MGARSETKINYDELKVVVEADASHMTCELATRFDFSHTLTIRSNYIKIFERHLKGEGAGQMFPHELNGHQKKNVFKACHSLLL